MVENRLRVGRVEVDVVRKDGLGRAAPSESVLHDHAIPLVAKRFDRVFPVPPVIAPPVQQHDGPAVRLADRRHVHVRDPHVLSEQSPIEELNRMRVRDVL